MSSYPAQAFHDDCKGVVHALASIPKLVDHKGYRLAPFYDLLCVKVYGDESLSLSIGDDDTFDAVGAHSWNALCEDCGFRLPETLKGFHKLALA